MITIKKDVYEFLKLLRKNNNREWFDKNKSLYEIAKENVDEFAAFLINEISSFDSAVPLIPA